MYYYTSLCIQSYYWIKIGVSKHLWNASYLASLKPRGINLKLNIQHASYLPKYTFIILLIIKFEIWYFWYINIPMIIYSIYYFDRCCDSKIIYLLFKRSGHVDLFSASFLGSIWSNPQTLPQSFWLNDTTTNCMESVSDWKPYNGIYIILPWNKVEHMDVSSSPFFFSKFRFRENDAWRSYLRGFAHVLHMFFCINDIFLPQQHRKLTLHQFWPSLEFPVQTGPGVELES